ncbi:MAG: hypothetical protein K2N48_00025 [Muribaculaceae bacterium]|nr:hypothetical protein [Muribaculaceae bacterium]
MEKIELNKSFSNERFSALLKSDLTVNKGNYIKLAIATLGVFAALAFMISFNAVMSINSLKEVTELTGRSFEETITERRISYGSMYLGLSSWILGIGLTVLGSLTFSNFSSKMKRISALMIPASRIEKFMLRLLVYLVCGTILLVLGLLLGFGICQIAFGAWVPTFNSVFEFFDIEYSGYIATSIILLALLGNSIYALGSSLWPKLSWIKTWVILMVIQWVGALVTMILAATHINWKDFFSFLFNFNRDNAWILFWSIIAILALLNISCWTFAWHRFRNTQIIQRFMTK